MIRSSAFAPSSVLVSPRIAWHIKIPLNQLARPAITFLVLLAMASLLYLVQASGVATSGYDIQTLEIQRRHIEARNEQLRARIAKLESLDRIESEARVRLQMQVPPRVTFLTFESGASPATEITMRARPASRFEQRQSSAATTMLDRVASLLEGR
jgi:cell division protein FtsB